MEDEEMNSISDSELQPESIDAATDKPAYQTEAALSSPVEVDVKKIEDISQSKSDENTVTSTENVMFGSEEEKTEESVLQNNMDVDNDNISKASKSSLRIILNNSEIKNISESQVSPDDCGAANASQSELVIVTHGHEEECAMLDLENVEFESEKEITQGSEIEKEQIFEEIEVKQQKIKEAKSLGEEEKIDDNDHQKEESNMEGDDQKANEPEKEKVVRTGPSTKRVLKKVEKTGMIFMCSKKTKQDCFDYRVFGLPASKRDVVHKVFKGMRLFLFDIDLRVMYGIYKAAAPGAYNIEPNAFQSAFPSQVQFCTVKDCMPLSEKKFRMAIKDNYYRKNMFNFELSSEQVKNLCKLFVAENKGPCLCLENDDLTNSSQTNDVQEKEKVVVEANGEDEKSAGEEEEEQEEQQQQQLQQEEGENEMDTGMIFMCSSKTKQDCLFYKVLGLPANKREIVQKIEKGMKLFMFDVDLRLMYGIYEATGPGGYNIEPKAFNSSFPSQVQFTVLKDCPPLTEEKFRTAIKDNYYRKNKFKFQLTSSQVTKLSELFVAGSQTLKQDDEDNASQSKELKGNCVEVRQANQIEESTSEVKAMVENYIKTIVEEVNKRTATEKEEVGVDFKEKTRRKRKRRREQKHCDGNKGMIFMCSFRTKPDCLYYKVLGLPANKREVVEKIHKGTRLFMFDVELRVMYGIYQAAGPGGYNLEPNAFNSDFPSQVRFTVVEDCLPLEEEKFKEAIKDNYYTKWKFDCELTSEQVTDLCRLFSHGNKRREGIRQQMGVPFSQFSLPAHPPMYGSYGNANVHGHVPIRQQMGVPFSQFSLPAHPPMYGSYGNANVHSHVPPLQPQVQLFEPNGQRSGWSMNGFTHPY